MSYDRLIAALIEEGEAKRQEVLRRAQAEQERLLAEARARAETQAREAEANVRQEIERYRTDRLSQARLTARLLLLQAKQEVIAAVWERASEIAARLDGAARTAVLKSLLDELIALAPPGSKQAVIDNRERLFLAPLLEAVSISYVCEIRDDLRLGLELHGQGWCLRNSWRSRLDKARPVLLVELARLLFSE